jgi:FlaA1/EpsC-like NDP-sugar epimerase
MDAGLRLDGHRMKHPFQIRNRFLLLADLVLIVTSVVASFALRLDIGPAFVSYLPQAWLMIAVALVVKPTVFYILGMYRRYWVYASVREIQAVGVATTTASIFVALFVILLVPLTGRGFPRSVLGIDWLISLFLIGGLRFSVRLIAELTQRNGREARPGGVRRVVVVGAGDAGTLMVREMQRNPQLHLRPVAFVDDDPEKLKKDIYGVRVAGRLEQLPAVVERNHADEVLIAIPTASGPTVRRVTEACRQRGIPFRTMPGIYELLGGKVSVSRLREVEISDLLRREPAAIDDEAVGRTLAGKRILVTGAGGSIGLELCRQITRWRPAELALLGHGENSIFEAMLELEENYGELPMHAVIADVRDQPRIQSIFERFRPDVVFHAAAHKHVPLMEVNVEEAVSNNVLGTQTVVNAALAHGTDRLVLISTDKAVQPFNVMGATKRIAELIVRDAARQSGKAFASVRFGNVLGSRGSIVPLFKRQIAQGGPVTITHPDMKRYFMTIPEAVHLVLQAAGMGEGGEVFVLRMGDQISVLELAEDLIRLSGLQPGRDIEIVFTGARAGEKLSESLWDEGMTYEPTAHPEIVRVEDEIPLQGESLAATVDELDRLAREGDVAAIVGLLGERVPGNLLGQAPPPDIKAVL